MSVQSNLSPTSPTMRKRQRTDLPGNPGSGDGGHPPPLPGPVGDDAFINDDAANDSAVEEDEEEGEKPGTRRPGVERSRLNSFRISRDVTLRSQKGKQVCSQTVLRLDRSSHMPIYRHYEKGNSSSINVHHPTHFSPGI
jgi:hypothetical protein